MLLSVARVLLVATIAWGAFAFGAVYPWAYWPLLASSVLVGFIGLVAPAPFTWRHLDMRHVMAAVGLLLAACAVQLLPLPLGLLERISPNTLPIAIELEPALRLNLVDSHPLSIVPAQTARALTIGASLTVLLAGTTRLLSLTGVTWLARWIALLGVLMALVGILQHPIGSGKLYGFWSPLQSGATPFGSFVNRNHFAGWMVMGLPLTLGLLCASIAQNTNGGRSGLRDRILWLSSPAANTLLLLAGATAVMTLSLMLTTSRSGIFAAALGVLGLLFSVRTFRSRGKKAVAVATVSAVLLLVVAWAGTEAVASRFSTGSIREDGRFGIWDDTLRVISLYPLAGTGLNTYDAAMHFYQRVDRSLRYAQAHNDYLQLAAEGGLLLSIPAALAIITLIVTIRRRFSQDSSSSTRWIRSGAVIGLLSIALQETLEFSLQMPGNACLFVVLCAVALHVPRSRRTHSLEQPELTA